MIFCIGVDITWAQLVSFVENWGELSLSALALILSLFAMFKANKAEKLQNKINELELKIKQYEVDKISKEKEEASRSLVEARVVSMGNGNYKLKVWNSGNTTVYKVSAKFEGDPGIFVFDSDKQPFDELEPRKNYELNLVTYSGAESKFKIITEWIDQEGKARTKAQWGDI